MSVPSKITHQLCLRRVLLSIVLWTPFTMAALRQAPPEADTRLKQLYSQARESQTRGDYRHAADEYTEILKLRPDLAEVRVNLGLMHHLLGEYAEAARQFETALRAEPQLFVPNLFLGLDLLELGQPQKALNYLRRAEQLDPQDAKAAVGLGQAYVNLHEYEKANSWYSRASEIAPGDAEAWFGLGITYLRLAWSAARQIENIGQGSVYARTLYAESLDERGASDDAVRAYQRLLALAGSPPCAHADLGFEYLFQSDQSRTNEAPKEFHEALSGDPGCLLARLGLARADTQQGNIKAALGQLTVAWKADPNFVKVNGDRVWRGLEPEKLADLEGKVKQMPVDASEPALVSFLVTALEKWQHGPVDSFLLASEPVSSTSDAALPMTSSDEEQATPAQLCSQGHYTSCAKKLMRRRENLPPDDLLLLANCAFNSGDYRTAFAAGETLIKRETVRVPGLYWQAKAGQKLAVRALTRASVLDPASPRMHLLIAEAYRERNSFREAEAEYRKAIQLAPNNVASHLGLAMVYWDSGENDKAAPEVQKALALKPGDPEASYIMGALLVDQDQYEEAKPYLNSALAGATAILPHVHALRGKVFAAQGRTWEAVEELKQSLSADLDGSYHFQLYQLYKKLGNEPAATAALQESESLRRHRPKPE